MAVFEFNLIDEFDVFCVMEGKGMIDGWGHR
jgi:hypothetical protein